MDDLTTRFPEVLARARQGDPAAWFELYEDLAPIVSGYLRGQRIPDPDDVAGEAFLQVVRDLGRFSGSHQQFRSWVLTIAHHRLVDAHRWQARRPQDPVAPDDLSSGRAPDDPEQDVLDTMSGDVATLLEPLTAEQRTVLLLRVVGDLSVAEVADVVGKSAGAVKALQHRAVETLRQRLAAGAEVTA